MITYGSITTGNNGHGKNSITWSNFQNFASAPEFYSPKFLLPTTDDTYCRLFLDCSQNKISMEMVSPDKNVVISGCLYYKFYGIDVVIANFEDHEMNDKGFIHSSFNNKTDIVNLYVFSARVVNKTKTPAVVKKSCTATFLSNLEKLLITEDYADVEIHCKDGEVVKCHKNLLAARSPVFKTMLDSDFKEKDSGTIKLEYMEIGIVKELLSFIYSGIVENTQNAMELLEAADQFQIQDLKDICGELLASTMAVDNVLEILAVADRYRLAELKTSAMAMVVLNAKTLVNTTKFKEFCTTCVDKQLVIDIVQAQANK